MRNWRDDFRQLAEELRGDDQPEAVAQLFEHIADLGSKRQMQLESKPWLRDVEALDYDKLILASVALNRVLDTTENSGKQEYDEALQAIVRTLEERDQSTQKRGMKRTRLVTVFVTTPLTPH